MNYRFIPVFNSLALILAFGLLPFASHAAQSGHEGHEHDQHQQHQEHQQLDTISGEEDPHAHHKAMMNKPVEPAESTRVELLDNLVVDQNGNESKFVSDIIGDRIVVVDFIYTTCTTVCPVISAIFSQVQDALGEQLGKEVILVSISVDAIRDTPRRLKAYSANHKAKPGWVWLTGKKRRMDKLLDGLGAYTTNFEDHPAMVLVGDGRTGEWSRFFGFPSPERIMKQVNTFQAARKTAMRE